MTVRDRRAELLASAADHRHGIVLKAQVARTGMADLAGVWHVGVPENTVDAWRSAAGGVGRDAHSARQAAIGEALERYAAVMCLLEMRRRSQLPAGDRVIEASAFSLFDAEQVAAPGFHFAQLYGDAAPYTQVYSIGDNAPVWVPHDLVSLRGTLSTSSGLAAGTTSLRALLRAVEELIERDALMVSWLHGVRGRRVALPARYLDEVGALGGSVTCIDATPAYSPHPVALVAGGLPLRGRPRYSLGAACRSTWEAAVEKAFLEWAQGVFFAGEYLANHSGLSFDGYDAVDTFDAHAAYYTTAPREWAKIALLHGDPAPAPVCEPPPPTVAGELQRLVARLRDEGVALYYRELTTIDLRQVGIHAVRVLSPDLTPIFCDPRHPFLGGRTRDVGWRYPWADPATLCFPNPLPHPLG